MLIPQDGLATPKHNKTHVHEQSEYEPNLKDTLVAIHIEAFNFSAGYDLWDQKSAEECLDKLLVNGDLHLRKLIDGQVVGFAITQEVKDSDILRLQSNLDTPSKSLFLAKIAISTQHRGQKHGLKLLHEVIKKSVEAEYDTLSLRVREDNHSMHYLILGAGFKQSDFYSENDLNGKNINWQIYKIDLASYDASNYDLS